MKSKLFLTVLVVFMLVGTMAGGAGVVLAETECDPAVVSQAGNVITVKPTGVEDTVNIQCAFDLAVATGPGVEVTLTEGTFYTAQIVVNDFHGDFSGAGVEKTLIYNMQDMYVTPVDYYLDLPSSNNPWPALFAFISGDFVISDLAIYIIGEKITTPYSMFGWEPTTLLALGVVILGSDVNARIERILLEGNAVENSLLPYNLANGIFFEGWFGRLLFAASVLALFYHLFNGIRHLVWDSGRALEIRSAYTAGWLVLIATILTTAVMLGVLL